MPFYLENVLHYNARQVGLLLAVVPIVLAILSPLSGFLSDKFGTRIISVIGLFFLLIGYTALTTLKTNTTAAGFILRFLFVGIGMGVFQSPNNSAIMGSAPRERLGVVSGILAITRSLGQTTGIALLGSIWAGLVMSMSINQITGGVTTASPQTQAAALRGTFTVVVILITIGLMVGVWAWVNEYRQSKFRKLSTLNDG
jgi:MFS family permease